MSVFFSFMREKRNGSLGAALQPIDHAEEGYDALGRAGVRADTLQCPDD